jgi:pimeloyl-ACP methyl ester carboxylesterase
MVHGVNLAVEVRGEGPAILFVHGYPLDRTLWSHQMDSVEGWRRIAPDLRGMGQSDAPDLGYSMNIYAADLAALLDVLGVDEVVLCGLSMGGYVCFEFLRRWRSRVKGLVLMDTRAAADSPDARRGRELAITMARESGAAAIADTMLPQLLSAVTQRRADIVGKVRYMVENTAVAGLVGALAAMRDRDESESLLPTLSDLPTLVLVGEDDPITPLDEARRIVHAIPGAQLAVVSGAAHLPPIEQPEETSARLQTFLESVR